MSQKTLAGTPNLRYPDPLVKRVNPNGTQPYTAYSAPLIYGDLNSLNSNFILDSPPDIMFVELLLFGADYPARISGIQQFTGNPSFDNAIYDAAGVPIPTTDLGMPLPPFFGLAGVDAVIDILPAAAPVPYKQIATGTTATNGVNVSGFPVVSFVPSRNLWQGGAGSSGPHASYILTYDVTLNGAVVDGPSFYASFITVAYPTHVPAILWEPNLTQKIVDDGYIIDVNGDGTVFFNVVGLWTSPNYQPSPPMLGARSATPATPAPVTPLSLLAATNPAMAEAAAAYAARVKNR